MKVHLVIQKNLSGEIINVTPYRDLSSAKSAAASLSYPYELITKDIVGTEHSEPTIWVSEDDFRIAGYVIGNKSDVEIGNMLSDVGYCMNKNECIMDCFWLHVNEAGREYCGPKYEGERYARVEYKWKDSDDILEDNIIISEDPVEEDSFEDNHSLYHVSDIYELDKLVKYGGEFDIVSIIGFFNDQSLL